MIVQVIAHYEKWNEMQKWLSENMANRWSEVSTIGTRLHEVEFQNSRDVTLFMLKWNSK